MRNTKLGLIERQIHPTDRRVKNLVLTAKVRRFKNTVPDKLWSGPNLFSTLTNNKRDQLVDLLKTVAATRQTDPSPPPDTKPQQVTGDSDPGPATRRASGHSDMSARA